MSAGTHNPNRAWGPQNFQALVRRDPDEQVSGKQRQIQFLPATVLPKAQGFVGREKDFDCAQAKVLGYDFLVTRANMERIPSANFRWITYLWTATSMSRHTYSFALSLR